MGFRSLGVRRLGGFPGLVERRRSEGAPEILEKSAAALIPNAR